MTNQEIYYEYEQILLGKRANYSPDLFNNKSQQGKEALALQFFRCVIDKYLHWSPEQALYMLNKEIIELMKLKPLIRHINFPAEFNINEDCRYIVIKAYPEKFSFNPKDYCDLIYNKILNDEIERFPKGFFEGYEGEERAIYCLHFAIMDFGEFKNIEEIYKYFSAYGNAFLKKYKLWDAFMINFDGYAIDYLHAIFTPEEQQENDFIYHKYRFKCEYKKKKTQLKHKKI